MQEIEQEDLERTFFYSRICPDIRLNPRIVFRSRCFQGRRVESAVFESCLLDCYEVKRKVLGGFNFVNKRRGILENYGKIEEKEGIFGEICQELLSGGFLE